jgi:hypothetical protein
MLRLFELFLCDEGLSIINVDAIPRWTVIHKPNCWLACKKLPDYIGNISAHELSLKPLMPRLNLDGSSIHLYHESQMISDINGNGVVALVAQASAEWMATYYC